MDFPEKNVVKFPKPIKRMTTEECVIVQTDNAEYVVLPDGRVTRVRALKQRFSFSH